MLGRRRQGSVRLSTQYNALGLLREIPVVSSSDATAAASASESLIAKSIVRSSVKMSVYYR